ncbi:MAG: glycerol-3-phosphate 1-O-acyltransferase PlsY [Bacteroidia bacterium]|nr:glycerol-3-phosphate 1-O-acyltransferase PlsY [Bacteroidia bacterium]
MEIFIFNLLIVFAYLLGAIPSSVWIGKIFFGLDLREHGSKNAGASNTFRVFGYKAGVPVLLFDIFKGWAAVKLAVFNPFILHNSNFYINYEIILGATAVLGHIFPVYIRFKGGKGVATFLGILIALLPYPTFISLIVFITTFFAFRMVSLSSLLTAISFPFIVFFLFRPSNTFLEFIPILVAVVIIITHLKNIGRLFKGEEARLKFSRKTKIFKSDINSEIDGHN